MNSFMDKQRITEAQALKVSNQNYHHTLQGYFDSIKRAQPPATFKDLITEYAFCIWKIL